MRYAFLAVLTALLFSCSPCKRLQRKCPTKEQTAKTDSIYIRDSILVRDTVIYYNVYFDTVYKEKKVYVNRNTGLANSDTLYLRSAYATALTWVSESKLLGKMYASDDSIRIVLDNAIKEAYYYKSRVKDEKQTFIQEKRYIPSFYSFTFWFFWIIILIFVLFILAKRFTSFIKF